MNTILIAKIVNNSEKTNIFGKKSKHNSYPLIIQNQRIIK